MTRVNPLSVATPMRIVELIAMPPPAETHTMKTRVTLFAFAALLAAPSVSSAQPPEQPPIDLRRDGQTEPEAPTPTVTPTMTPTMTPEMWLYEQQRQRYDDPKETVRRNAKLKAQQRRARIASRKWFGYSNLRPVASTSPFYETYSPGWRSNSHDPYLWTTGYPSVVLYPNWSMIRMY